LRIRAGYEGPGWYFVAEDSRRAHLFGEGYLAICGGPELERPMSVLVESLELHRQCRRCVRQLGLALAEARRLERKRLSSERLRRLARVGSPRE